MSDPIDDIDGSGLQLLDRDQMPIGHLVIGHTTDRSARAWFQGTRHHCEVVYTVRDSNNRIVPQRSDNTALKEDRDFTGTVDIHDLEPSSEYELVASFRSKSGSIETDSHTTSANFTTFPSRTCSKSLPFAFLLGSCNLSVVSINNVGMQALQIVGAFAARESLKRPISDRKPAPRPRKIEALKILFGRWLTGRKWGRWLVSLAIGGSHAAVFLGSGGKWPGQPLLRSPFLKLEALFAGHEIRFDEGKSRPSPGQILYGARSGASGILAFSPAVNVGTWPGGDDGEDEGDEEKHDVEGVMLMVDRHGEFIDGERLIKANGNVDQTGPTQGSDVAGVVSSKPFAPCYMKPAFTIHAGDQIYFDVPEINRVPHKERYREAYREAWFEDRYQRAFLRRGSHYMSMDDHELIDQFSLDREPPDEDDVPEGWEPDDFAAGRYKGEAMAAYRDYVQSRHPPGTRYYEFSHGAVQFFVMDTRTERRRHENSRMIDDDQMCAFKKWLVRHRDDLKFVVSSVPFVAEVISSADPSAEDSEDRAADKWCGAAFRLQRDEIIDFIHDQDIDRLLFLVGDMHCAYHASMAIGKERRWKRRRIHELAGGPIHQLELGRRGQFATSTSKRTRQGKIRYDSQLHHFHGNACAIMHIEVDEARDSFERHRDGTSADHAVPVITWKVIRTMTDPEINWERSEGQPEAHKDREAGRLLPPDGENPVTKESIKFVMKDQPPISGRITFPRRPTSPADREGET